MNDVLDQMLDQLDAPLLVLKGQLDKLVEITPPEALEKFTRENVMSPELNLSQIKKCFRSMICQSARARLDRLR
jgi:hypothetical protein